MRSFCVKLKEFYDVRGGELEGIVVDYPWNDQKNPNWKRPALLIVPGGTYWSITNRECDPIASAFLGKGFQTFTLRYLCAPDGVRYPEQLIEEAAPQFRTRPHRRFRRKELRRERKAKPRNAERDEDETARDDIHPVPRGDADVDDVRHDERDEKLHARFEEFKQGREDRHRPIGFHTGEQVFQNNSSTT